jgi:ribosomal protein S18 acetylase RimI-like enzyme
MKNRIEIKSLENLDRDRLFTAFREAFADYEMQLNRKELFRMLKRRGYTPELSYGAFDQDHLVSFTLNGIGLFQGRRTSYDTGTGTHPDYRGRGLAGAVFRHAEKELKASGIRQYLLEVLQHNSTAVKLYKKLGFEITRSFNYFHQDAKLVRIHSGKAEAKNQIRSIPIKTLEDVESGEFPSSWQNSIPAIQRSPEDFSLFGSFHQDRLTGFLVTDPQTGDLTQILVFPEYRRQGIGTALVEKALQINRHRSLKLINSDTRDTGLTKFMESLNIPLQGKQYEMIKSL